MKKQRRIVLLEEVSPDQRDFTSVQNCFYCYCPKHTRKVKAVAAVEVDIAGEKMFFGICGNHAEVYELTEEQERVSPMLCPYCYPRQS